ncbi:MAG: amidohydrolase [Clostridiales Family XIII bacterium]|jgi:5-methylthioadenosine/S-adenosylhomocysteine deaminase|nr:amidohydrolase [Clostridiales Family XIII bacterium]
MLFQNAAVLDEDFSVVYDRFVWIDGPRIAYIGAAPPVLGTGAAAGSDSFGEVIDGGGLLLMPGFYNAHTHSPMSLLRGYGENMQLSDWLENRIFPFEDRLTGGDVYWATLLSMAESFAHGIISSSDMYYHCEDILRAACESGAKMNISRGLSFFGEGFDLAAYGPYAESRKLYYENHGAAGGRIRVDMALHAEFTSTPGLVRAAAALSAETGAPVHVHVSETKKEHEECKARHGGLTPVAYLADGGIFEQGGLAAHCVWITEEDADILREKGVTAATCPVSNLKLASGVMNAPMLLCRGVNIAIGTDGQASNNSLNLFEEIKLFALLCKERYGDPTLITPAQALYAATRAGALCQGRTDCGVLKAGNRADILVLDSRSPSLNPVHDAAGNLVYAASSADIRMTIIDGRTVYRDGAFPTVDMERILFETERSKSRILGELM